MQIELLTCRYVIIIAHLKTLLMYSLLVQLRGRDHSDSEVIVKIRMDNGVVQHGSVPLY